MKKKLSTFAIVAGLLMAALAFAKTAKEAPDSITVDACKNKKPPVTFAHKKHFTDNKIACDTCHHQQKGLKLGAATEVKKCTSCHKTPEKADTPKCTEMSSKKNPFHIRCVGCHKELKKGPKKCKECHKK